jgi:hypothetical protein
MDSIQSSSSRILSVALQQSFILPEGDFYFVNDFQFQGLAHSSTPQLFLFLTRTKLWNKYQEVFLMSYEFDVKTPLHPRKISHKDLRNGRSEEQQDTFCIKVPENVNNFLDIDIKHSKELKVPVSKLFNLKEKMEMPADVGFYLYQVYPSKNGRYLCGIIKMTIIDSPHYFIHIWNVADKNNKNKVLEKTFNSLMDFGNFKLPYSHQGWMNHISSVNRTSKDSQLNLTQCLEYNDALIFADSHGNVFITHKNSYHPFEDLQTEKQNFLRKKHLSEKDLKCFSIKKFGRMNALTTVPTDGNRECLDFTQGFSARIIPLVSGKISLMKISRKHKKLFLVSDSENCCLQLSIIENKISWDSDFKLMRHISSLSSLGVHFEKLNKKLMQSTLRKELQQMKSTPEDRLGSAIDKPQESFYLTLKRVFGRKAFRSRNNLLAGKKNKIIFNSCSLVCALDITSYRLPQKSPCQNSENLKMSFYGIESLIESATANGISFIPIY